MPPAAETPEHPLLSHAGGLRYHLRALRHRGGRWRSFRSAVHGWLEAWRPPCRQLVLVGPSAGHTLALEALPPFEHIIVLEPDPLARAWLRRRAGRLPLRFEAAAPLERPDGLERLAERYPQAALLFCNLLGQLAPPVGPSWQPLLARALGQRHWASYHDVISTARPPRPDAPREVQAADALEAVLSHFWSGGEIALVDHATFRLAGPSAARYAVWPLTDGQYHLIEWVTHAPAPR